MNVAGLALRAVRHHRALALGAALGIALATAVITGALVLGDSLSGTLAQRLAARRGPITHALLAPRPLRPALAEAPGLAGLRWRDGTATTADGAVVPARIAGVDARGRALLGLPELAPRTAALSPALARDLGVRPGDDLTVAVTLTPRLPAASFLAEGRHERLQRAMRVTVGTVLDAGFSLDPGLEAPRCVWLDRAWLAGAIGDERIDAIVAAGDAALPPAELADLGLRLLPDPALGQVTVQGDALVLPPALAAAAQRALAPAQAQAIHLADRIVREGGGEASYALVAAREGEGPDADGIDLSAWLASDLGATPGDRLRVAFPQRAGGLTNVALTVRAIIPDAEIARDPALVPTVPGLTDAERIERWDLPYRVESARISARDDAWWAAHRTAPKALISVDLARRLWEGGPWIAGLRVRPAAGETLDACVARCAAALRAAIAPADAGLLLRDLRRDAAVQARGNADLGGLFLGLGSVVILAGLALAAALVRFQLGRRAAEVGVLRACGWGDAALRRLLLAEALAIAGLGAIAGTALGVGWAWLLTRLLAAGWGGAAVGLPLSLHLSASSLLIGGLSGLLAGTLAAAWGLRALLARAPLDLLAGWRAPAPATVRLRRLPLALAEPLRFPGRSLLAIGLMAAAAAVLVLVAAQRRGLDDPGRDGPTGGFALRLTTALPLPEDLATPAGRARLGFATADEAVLAGMRVAAFLVGPGEDISCRNPARPAQPRILGCLAAPGGFGIPDAAWADLGDGDPIPVLGDADSLRWTLGIDPAAGAVMPINGSERRLRVAAAFPASVFAGELVMGEAAFRRCFPAVAAPTCFLLALPPERAAPAAAILRRRLAGLGPEVRPAAELVAEQFAVRGAYLALFLALGGLGLAIGAGGLAVVLARSAHERRAELALLAALGRRPGLVLFAGHAAVLALGLLLGLGAGALAVLLGPPAPGAWGAALPAVLAVAAAGLAAAALAARRSRAELVQELRRE